MLRKTITMAILTAIASAFAIGDFFFMRELSKPLAVVVHNALASLVGAGFIVSAEMIRRQIGKIDLYYVFFLAIGLGMLAIHLVKIVLTRC
jgi:hypothetical protein